MHMVNGRPEKLMGDLATRTRLAAALGWAMNARVGRDRDERTEEPYVHLPTSSRSTGPGTDAGPSTLELKGCQCQNFLILAEDSSAPGVANIYEGHRSL